MFLKVELAPSRLLQLFLLAAHLLAIFSVLATDLPILDQAGLAIGVLYSFLHCRTRAPEADVLLFVDGNIRLYKGCHKFDVALELECYCSSWLQILYFQKIEHPPCATSFDGMGIAHAHRRPERFCVILLPDSSCAASRRQLAVLLRWGRFNDASITFH